MPKVIFRQTAGSEIDDVISFVETGFARPIGTDYYLWKYSYQGMLTSFVATYEEQIIGHIGFSLRTYSLEDDQILGASRHSTIVDERFRGQGLYNSLYRFSEENLLRSSVSLIQGWPNLRNMKAYRYCDGKYELIGIPCLVRNTRILESDFDPVKAGWLHASFGEVKIPELPRNRFSVLKDKEYLSARYERQPSQAYYMKLSDDGSLMAIGSKPQGEANTFVILELFDSVEYDNPVEFVLKGIAMSYSAIKIWINPNSVGLFRNALAVGFVPSEPISFCSFRVLNDSFGDKLSLGPIYEYAMGDSDGF